jgi:hypothetical protein
MQLGAAQVKPSSSAPRKADGLGNLVQPEDIAIETPCLFFTAARHRQLHVVESKDGHVESRADQKVVV